MNPVIQAMIDRRSIKSYTPEPVPDALLEEILQAGIHAATGMGKQSPVIVVLRDPAQVTALERMNAAILGAPEAHPFYGASTVLVVLARADIPTAVYDGSLVLGNLLLAASSLGLGACWIHRAKEEFASDEGKALLRQWGLTDDYLGIGHCIVGYPTADPAPARPRKPDYILRP